MTEYSFSSTHVASDGWYYEALRANRQNPSFLCHFICIGRYVPWSPPPLFVMICVRWARFINLISCQNRLLILMIIIVIIAIKTVSSPICQDSGVTRVWNVVLTIYTTFYVIIIMIMVTIYYIVDRVYPI